MSVLELSVFLIFLRGNCNRGKAAGGPEVGPQVPVCHVSLEDTVAVGGSLGVWY